jgi:hypothetical protein
MFLQHYPPPHLKFLGARIVFRPREKHLTILFKRHPIIMTELKIGAVGTEFSKRTSWWARAGPGRWNSMKNGHLLKCMQLQQVTKHISKSHISGRSWVHPEREYDARRHQNGPGANRTIDTLTMINVLCCTRSWIYVWYYGRGISRRFRW